MHCFRACMGAFFSPETSEAGAAKGLIIMMMMIIIIRK